MHSSFNLTGQQQKNEQAARIMELAQAKHERVVKLANIILDVLEHGIDMRPEETEEEYLTRLGVDVTKI